MRTADASLFNQSSGCGHAFSASAGHPLPVALYEQMLDALDDQGLVRLVNERRNEALMDVDLDTFA